MKASSIDLRERVLADFQGGMKFTDLGRKYSVSAEWVRQFIRRYQATGEIAARPPLTKRCRSIVATNEHCEQLWPNSPILPWQACGPNWDSTSASGRCTRLW